MYQAAFERLIVDNGIVIPHKRLLEPSLIFKHRKANFQKKWRTAYECFQKFNRAVEIMENEQLWNRCNAVSDSLYHKPIVRTTSTPAIPCFTNPSEAEEALSTAISLCRDPRNEVAKNHYSFYKEWLFSLLEKRPVDSSLVVIKDNSYVPKPENGEKFAADVLSGKPARISYFNGLFEKIYWVTVPVEEAESQDFGHWCMDPDDCTVEYY